MFRSSGLKATLAGCNFMSILRHVIRIMTEEQQEVLWQSVANPKAHKSDNEDWLTVYCDFIGCCHRVVAECRGWPRCLSTNSIHAHTHRHKCTHTRKRYRCSVPDRYTHWKSKTNMKGAEMKNELFAAKKNELMAFGSASFVLISWMCNRPCMELNNHMDRFLPLHIK